MDIHEVPTPALLVERSTLDHNVETMTLALPGQRLRPHVKAFKSTALARILAEAGHRGFCCATTREMVGLAEAGLGDDLLLANEVVDSEHLATLAGLERSGRASVTIAVDSEATVDLAAESGIGNVLIDVNVGLPRCGCAPGDAGRLAERARDRQMTVRGVMGYEGHVVGNPDRVVRATEVEASMTLLTQAHEQVGGDVVSAGGTGTYDLNTWATEIQAGSYTLMDTAYAQLDLPFRQALSLWTTVVSVNDGWAVCDGGLKSLGMNLGDPSIEGAEVWFCSDEHITFAASGTHTVAVGDRVRVWPAHVDPTVARHQRLYVTDHDDVVDVWPVDLRHW